MAFVSFLISALSNLIRLGNKTSFPYIFLSNTQFLFWPRALYLFITSKRAFYCNAAGHLFPCINLLWTALTARNCFIFRSMQSLDARKQNDCQPTFYRYIFPTSHLLAVVMLFYTVLMGLQGCMCSSHYPWFIVKLSSVSSYQILIYKHII